jgi:dolichol-phosphate mannosyltransferase
MSILGFTFALMGFIYALFILYSRLTGSVEVTGFTATMIVILVLGGLQMMMMGVLGEYLWRGLDESRRRPRYMIEEETRD